MTSSSLDTRPQNELYDVDLTAANNVWVVGYSGSRGLIAHWNGTSWTSNPYPDATYEGIALDPDADARVVGVSYSGGSQPLMARYHLNGSTIILSAAFVDTRLTGSNFLFGVAVTTTNDVWAVGNYTVTEHYDGLSFELVPAELVGTTSQWLYRVAIDPVRDGAWAVGQYTNGSTTHPLVERYARPVTPQPPIHTTSRYMRTISPTLTYNQGYQQAISQESGIVVLHFGGAAGQGTISGTILHDDDETFVSVDQIIAATEAFATGFYTVAHNNPTTHPPTIVLAIGTSNDITTTWDQNEARAHGKVWAKMVNQVHSDVSGYYPYVTIAGANDIEILYSSPGLARAWADGYSSITILPYYDYGACEYCPPAASMTNSWTITDVYYVSWHSPRALPLPQIYATNGINAAQWREINRYTYSHDGYPMLFKGSFTQYDACQTNGCLPFTDNTPEAGWRQLWQALYWDVLVPAYSDLQYSTDITWRP